MMIINAVSLGSSPCSSGLSARTPLQQPCFCTSPEWINLYELCSSHFAAARSGGCVTLHLLRVDVLYVFAHAMLGCADLLDSTSSALRSGCHVAFFMLRVPAMFA